MKDQAERAKGYRERKKLGLTAGQKVQAKLAELEARIEALEGFMRPGMGKTVPCTPNNQLAQLRAQIAAVPPRRPEQIVVPNPVQMPVQPFGEWEPA